MVTSEVSQEFSNQLQAVINKAREKFADRFEEEARAGRIKTGPISEADKQSIENMFSEAVYSYVIAETAAFVTSLIYSDIKDDNAVCRITPSFLDQLESALVPPPTGAISKTDNIQKLAKGVLESGKEKSGVVLSLLHDITDMSPVKPMRASYDAVMLSLLGE
jgi:hypothetical protein